jgi:pimeloyl-ACP methyl ester carboxylesterase/DNA-binding CsgD family transcriptional regulator
LVERNVANVEVASSRLVSRSKNATPRRLLEVWSPAWPRPERGTRFLISSGWAGHANWIALPLPHGVMATFTLPEVRFAKNGDVSLAYQVVGEGEIDLVFVPGFISHALAGWEEPRNARFLRRLASFSRLITFDKRGTGMSDPMLRLPSQREQVDDVRAVMEAAGSRRAALLGYSAGGSLAVMFAATYPQRVSALVTFNAPVKYLSSPDFPWGWTQDRFERTLAEVEGSWADIAGIRNPSLLGDQQYRKWAMRYLRLSASPGMARLLMQMSAALDLRPVLPRLKLPVLIMHRREDPIIDVAQARYMASHIPSATLIELDGADHWPWIGDSRAPVDHIERFLTGGIGKRPRRSVIGTDALTDRERAVVRLAVRGHSAADIGRQLFISERTVETHLSNAYAKLGISSKVELAHRAAELEIK